MKKRVVVTGMGAITPIGNSVDSFWESVKQGKIGFDRISYFDSSEYKCKLAAEMKDFNAENYMDKKSARRMEQFCQFAVAAAKEAIKDAGIDMEKEDAFRVGCAVGSGIGSIQAMEREYTKLVEKGPSKISPLFVPLMISNMAAGNVSIMFGLKGKNINVVTACATGTNSIGEAFRTIQYGDADIMLAGGTESSITPLGVGGFAALTALSPSEDPARCSIPFDKDRSGFVMGEGAGIVVLEELEHAKARGAKIYAEVAGYGCSADAFHITSPAEDGSGAAAAMINAVKDAGIQPTDITYINAHGTSTHHNDLFETRAIKYAFGDHAYNIKINSTKSMIGHLLGAAGAVEFVTCVKEIEEGFIHKTVGLQESEEEMDLNYCKESSMEDIVYALSNSLGFGGHNASILIKKYSE
ncbi:MAG: beta-ketoacyl-ACP synthase II [Lachnospiraceae bacterium]|nr:beta-ketoacyl-ACP synthase II [Lachnospiraceae bacterium]